MKDKNRRSSNKTRVTFKTWVSKHKRLFCFSVAFLYILLILFIDIPITMLLRNADERVISAWSYFRWFTLLGSIPMYKFAKTFCD